MPDELTVAAAGFELVHVPAATLLVSTIVEPSHTAEGPPIAEGEAFIVTAVVYVIAQPAPVPLLTVSEYVPVPVVGIDGTLAEAVDAPVIDAGPSHRYEVTFEGPLLDKLSVLLAHRGAFDEMPDTDGPGLTVSTVAAKQPPETI